MRLPFMMLVRVGAAPEALLARTTIHERAGMAVLHSPAGDVYGRVVARGITVTGRSGTWNAWACVTDVSSIRDATALHRWARRRVLASNDLIGPFGLARSVELGLLSAIRGVIQVPWVIAGDSSRDLARPDYRPSDDECINDVYNEASIVIGEV